MSNLYESVVIIASVDVPATGVESNEVDTYCVFVLLLFSRGLIRRILAYRNGVDVAGRGDA